jgi:alpha-L-fucosidase
LIFLVKHHDGFCLYDTELTDYKSTGSESAWKVDVMREVADACHKHDLKLIIYYSQPDWHHPDYLSQHHERYVAYLHGQIRELLTGYGRIDGLWFDNLRGVSSETAKLWDAEKLFTMARSLQPHLIINNRCGLPGDFDTPEQRIGYFQADRPWESCCTLGTQWSWKPEDRIKSLEECIQMLVGCAIGNGNLALNTNPMPDGRIEPRQAERFREIGRWMSRHGESIYATRGGPFLAPDGSRGGWRARERLSLPAGRWWGGSTHRDNVVYLHILRWPEDTLRLPDIKRTIVDWSVLTGGHAEVRHVDEAWVITVPPEHRDPLDTIVKLEFDGSLDGIEPVGTGPPSLGQGRKATASGVWPDPYLPAELAFDGDPNTRWGAEPGANSGWLAIDLEKPICVSRAVIDEGDWDRVRRFELQFKSPSGWQTIVTGTTLGPAKELSFPPVEAQLFRLNILEASNVPTIWEVAFYGP